MAKDNEDTIAVTYISLNLLSLVGNSSVKLRKLLGTFKWFVAVSIAIFLFSLVSSIVAFCMLLPENSDLMSVKLLFWLFTASNGGLVVLSTILWIVLCYSRNAYNLMLDVNRAKISSTLACYALFTILGIASIALFDDYYDVTYVTKAQLLVDLQMSLSWTKTMLIVFLLGILSTVNAFGCFKISSCPQVAAIKLSSDSVKDMINSAAAQ